MITPKKQYSDEFREQGLKGNTVAGVGGQRLQANLEASQDGVTKKGTIIYRVGQSAIRDDGDRLNVSREATKEGLEKALRMAMERYGNRIAVTGGQDFKHNIVRAAVAAKLPITFADAKLERERQLYALNRQKAPPVPPIGAEPPPAVLLQRRMLNAASGQPTGEYLPTLAQIPTLDGLTQMTGNPPQKTAQGAPERKPETMKKEVVKQEPANKAVKKSSGWSR